MKIIPAFETSDKKRFFVESDARDHERGVDFSNLLSTACRTDPEFARLDTDLLVKFMFKHGSTVGKLADAPIAAMRPTGGTVNPAVLDKLAAENPLHPSDRFAKLAGERAKGEAVEDTSDWREKLPKTRAPLPPSVEAMARRAVEDENYDRKPGNL